MLSQWIFLTNLVISSSPYRTVLPRPVPLFFYSSFHFTTFSPFIIDAQNIKNGKFMMMHKSEVGRELCRQVRDFPTRINLELARKLGKQSFIEQQKLKRHTIPSPKFTCKDRTLRAWSMPHYWSSISPSGTLGKSNGRWRTLNQGRQKTWPYLFYN